MFWYHILAGLICLIVGFCIGGINGRRVKRAAMLELNTNSLQMLKAKARFIETESRDIDIERKDRLLQDTQLQLKASVATEEKAIQRARNSDLQVKKLQQDLIVFSKKQSSTLALWKQKAQNSHKLAVQSHVKAMEATALARNTAVLLKRRVNLAIAEQNLSTSELKSHGSKRQEKLRILDQARPGYEKSISKKVVNGDSTLSALN